MTATGSGALSATSRIGFLGDTHGDMQHVLAVAKTMSDRGIELLVVLGDFGFLWPGRNWGIDIDKLSRRLKMTAQTLAFVDGNHEDFDLLYKFPVADDGLRWIRPNIVHIPRGYRTVLASGATLAALGGANSVDIGHRVLGRSVWVEESITNADLTKLGPDHADVLIGHDAPLDLPSLDAWLAATNHGWPPAGLKYSAEGRAMFHRGFQQARPRLYLAATTTGTSMNWSPTAPATWNSRHVS
ncbi:metallophosphoesterase [Cryobacterium sp. M23]|uniref:metallophosphoesterase family protein n=1 Tax=Cryobacterium sp. M23 TaxID=2048292 RepID=UPI000CE4819D|nr:metallophosphoesterase [Cryobacterium sp. M23]